MPTYLLLKRIAQLIWLLLSYLPISKRFATQQASQVNHHIKHFHCRLGEILGVRTAVTGLAPSYPSLVVSNHISWHDIVAIGQHTDIDFVAKAEISQWPIIGTLAARGGTLFIDRGSREAASSIIDIMSTQLLQKSVLVFPESTTTLGDQMLPFKRRLFQAAHNANTPIQPIALYYEGRDRNGERLGYGNESFLRHAIRTMKTHTIVIHIHFCEPFIPMSDNSRNSSEEAEKRIRAAKHDIEQKLV